MTKQETTKEFAHRLNRAVEMHPTAPPTPFGRQRWLMRKLDSEAGVSVSANSVSKWMNGDVRPKEDNIRALARVLAVDEVWLSLGRKPLESRKKADKNRAKASGAVMMVAGLIEMSGGRVTFPGGAEGDPHLWANLEGEQYGLLVVSPQTNADEMSFILPEPVGDFRVFGVLTAPASDRTHSAQIKILDLTEADRTNLGGFSVVVLNKKARVTPLPGIEALATA